MSLDAFMADDEVALALGDCAVAEVIVPVDKVTAKVTLSDFSLDCR